jgi:hypothetical protein
MTPQGFGISPDLKAMLAKWQTHERKTFNIFRMVSDTYHRENFHSDILKVLLDGHPDSLYLFIALLNNVKESLNIDPALYRGARIEREPGRIDILINSEQNNRGIIVENKINNAPDMHEQLSRYYNTSTHRWKLTIDAIVYLSLDGAKDPSPHAYQMANWKEVEAKVIKCAAFNNRENDLISAWLEPLYQREDIDDDFRLTILQYIDIVKELGEDCMNKDTQMLFVNWIAKDKGNFEQCKQIAELFCQRHLFALRIMAERYNSPECKNSLHIESAEVGRHRGAMLTIRVRHNGHEIRVEISDCGNTLRLLPYADPNDPLAKTKYQPFCNATGTSVFGQRSVSSEGTVAAFYGWPAEERELLEAADKLIELSYAPAQSTHQQGT